MHAVELHSYSDTPDLHVVEKPIPRPGKGQVLVKMAAAPINPSDLMFLRGMYGVKKRLPVVPGFEGSGTVIATGNDLISRFFMGRRVACTAPDNGDGTWADFMITSATLCFPLVKNVSLEQGAMTFVNPFTAWALIDIAKRGEHRVILHTAAASQLGRMMIRIGQRRGVEIVNIVRRPEQVALLGSLGAKIVLNSSEPGFDDQLKKVCREMKVRLAFDAVAGEMTGRVLQAMPSRSRVTVYGALSVEGCLLHPGDFIFRGKSIDGFYLPNWLYRQSLVSQLLTAYRVQRLLTTDLQSTVYARVPITDGVKGIETYTANMTGGKVLLVPSSES